MQCNEMQRFLVVCVCDCLLVSCVVAWDAHNSSLVRPRFFFFVTVSIVIPTGSASVHVFMRACWLAGTGPTVRAEVRDIWAHKGKGLVTGGVTVTLASHDSAFLTLKLHGAEDDIGSE
jgi:hypothetical protein